MEECRKLVIGTAQFGLDYGITNLAGKVGLREVKTILALAKKSNIYSLDTASLYGDSESVLGQVGVNGFDVITKLPEIDETTQNLSEAIERKMLASLERLKLNYVDSVLLHRPEQLNGMHGEEIYAALQSLKCKGLARRIGISIYSPVFLDKLPSKFKFDVVQAPLNVFDQRLLSSGWLKKLHESNTSVMARSIFLQGTLLAQVDELPEYFQPWDDKFRAWNDYCFSNNISRLRAALKFVSQISEVEKIIVGIETADHLSEIIQALMTPAIAVPDWFSVNDLALVNPNNWQH